MENNIFLKTIAWKSLYQYDDSKHRELGKIPKYLITGQQQEELDYYNKWVNEEKNLHLYSNYNLNCRSYYENNKYHLRIKYNLKPIKEPKIILLNKEKVDEFKKEQETTRQMQRRYKEKVDKLDFSIGLIVGLFVSIFLSPIAIVLTILKCIGSSYNKKADLLDKQNMERLLHKMPMPEYGYNSGQELIKLDEKDKVLNDLGIANDVEEAIKMLMDVGFDDFYKYIRYNDTVFELELGFSTRLKQSEIDENLTQLLRDRFSYDAS